MIRLSFLLSDCSDTERVARCRELRALSLVYLGLRHPVTVAWRCRRQSGGDGSGTRRTRRDPGAAPPSSAGELWGAALTQTDPGSYWKGKTMNERPVDHYTAAGAARLAQRVHEYWRSRGHVVDVQVVELPRVEKRNGRAWTIATDGLVAGLPVGVIRPAPPPASTPLDIVRREFARGRSVVEAERLVLREFPNLSRQELRAAFRDAGAANGW
jgi:hypothetical protein